MYLLSDLFDVVSGLKNLSMGTSIILSDVKFKGSPVSILFSTPRRLDHSW